MMKGALDFLTGRSAEACQLREAFVFKVGAADGAVGMVGHQMGQAGVTHWQSAPE